jgi:signal transduction histidine kinase
MRSLKGTLYRGVILGTAFVLVIAGTGLYISVDRQLIRQMDESLADKVRTLSLSIEEKHYGLEVDLEEMRLEEMEEANSSEYVLISSMDGRTIYNSDKLDGFKIPGIPVSLEEPRHDWVVMKGAGKVRSVIYKFQPAVDDEEENLESVAADPGIIVNTTGKPGDQVVIQLLKDTRNHQRFMDTFLLMLLATGLGSIGVLSLTVWMTIKKGAEPINELASRIDAIQDDDLATRLEEAGVLTELTPIVSKMNLFLDRLEESFNRERGFTSDAAHELRTPLAGLKSTIEVALTREREGIEYRKTLERSLTIVNQLESLVKSLLALARLESGQEAATGSEVLLEACIRDAWMPCSEAADEKHLETSFNLGNGSKAILDGDLLSQVLDELFRNAVYYTDEGGSLRVSLRQDEGNTLLRVSNTGCKVSVEDSAHVFDRFWRGSHSRDDTGVRFGLGLPIVRKIVDTMGLKMDIQAEMDGEFVVTLILPERPAV